MFKFLNKKMKQKIMEFSIQLAGWVLDDPFFLFKIKKKILQLFILPEMHFKANFFPQPTINPQENWEGIPRRVKGVS